MRITILVIAVLSAGIGVTISYYLRSQNESILESRKSAIKEEINVLYYSIKNSMLAGEAPIAVDLFSDFARIDDMGDIKLYRSNGVRAFSDNSTLDRVNGYLKRQRFRPKTAFLDTETITDVHFKKSVSAIDDVIVQEEVSGDQRLVVYKPLINQPKCSRCHGLDHIVRGIIRISSPLNQVYSQARMNLAISAVIFSIVVFILSLSIMYFINRIVIEKIFRISRLVQGVGRGDFRTKYRIGVSDEIGMLGGRINDMIDGLNERFKLTRFVSKSTMDHVRDSDEIILGGEKISVTVLFTDIRGFTSFSEKRDPNEVMQMLNSVMNVQAEIIDRHGGDIDKYVGDEIMAIFRGTDMVIMAARAAVEIRDTMKVRYSLPGNEIFVGIGINTGEVISGNLGSGKRMDRTVIGDTVNLGSRLCSAAGRNTIVISEDAYREIEGRVNAKKHDPIRVRGKSLPVNIYVLRGIL